MSESYRSRSADVGRLGEPRESSSPPQRGTSRVVDTMLFARFELPDTITRDEDISNLCSDNLVMKKGEGRLSRNNVMNAPRWANPAGMGLMERFDNLDKEISTLKTEVSSLKTEGTSLKAEVSSLTAEGTSLKAEVSSLKVEVRLVQNTQMSKAENVNRVTTRIKDLRNSKQPKGITRPRYKTSKLAAIRISIYASAFSRCTSEKNSAETT